MEGFVRVSRRFMSYRRQDAPARCACGFVLGARGMRHVNREAGRQMERPIGLRSATGAQFIQCGVRVYVSGRLVAPARFCAGKQAAAGQAGLVCVVYLLSCPG